MGEESRSRVRAESVSMPAHELAEAAKRLDLELDRVCRIHSDAVLVRTHVASVSAVIAELAQLEQRRDALAKELGELEAKLVTAQGAAKG